jgi:hypothetical protein
MPLQDISDYSNNSDWLPILASVIIVDVIGIFIFSLIKNTGTQIYKWYVDFGLIAFFSDVLVIVLDFVIVRYIYKIYVYPKYGFNPALFISLLLCVQIIHDILYYYLIVIQSTPGRNTILDFMKKYGKEFGSHAIISDSLMVFASALIAMILKGYPAHISVTVLISILYIAQYALTTRRLQ